MSENINMVDALHKTIYNQNQQIAELKKQLEEKDKEMAKLRELRAIKDDASQCVVVNGVKFSYEQILIIQDMNYNYDMKIKNLKQQLESQPAEIVEKIKEIAIIDVEEYSNDHILYKITEEELDTILKEYQK